MNITSISNNLPGIASRPVAADAAPAELRQVSTSKVSPPPPAEGKQPVSEPQKGDTSRRELEDAVKQVNDFLKPINNSIQFNLDEDTGKTVVKVIDLATKEVIRQFPSEEMLSIAKAIDKMKGLLIQQQA